MKIIRDEIALCEDCMLVAVTGEADSIDYHYGRGESPGRGELRDGARERMHEIETGLQTLGRNLVPAFDSETGKGYDEFSSRKCQCCQTHLAGARYEFAVLGPN